MKNETPFDNPNNNVSKNGRPISQILQEIVDHITEIIRSEVRLARAEFRQDVSQVGKASVFLAVGTVFGLYALGFVFLGVVHLIATTLPLWISALLVGVGLGVVAAIFLQIGRNRFKRASLRPDTTIQTLQENVTWMKRQAR